MKKLKILRHHIVVFLISVLAGSLIVNWTEGPTESILRWGFCLVNGFENNDGTTITIDSQGLPIVDYGVINGVQIGLQHNPVTICQQAFNYFDGIHVPDSINRQRFLKCANWIVDNSEFLNDGNVLPYRFIYPRYSMPSYWISAMAQAQAIQVMVRAHRLTGDSRYIENARKLLSVFSIDVDSGGVAHKHLPLTSGWWYEEYASPSGDDPMPLNGMMYTLIGLKEFHNYTNDSTSNKLFTKGIQALKDILPSFDRNGHSYYDILGLPAGGDYHLVHIELLDTLYRLTGDNILAEYRNRWQEYNDAQFVVRFIKAPTKIAPVILAANIAFLFVLIELLLFFKRRTKL